jgi:aspartate/methionine/tyrosine aminotransferase
MFTGTIDEMSSWLNLAKQVPGCLRLDKGEPDFAPHSRISDVAIRSIKSNQIKYNSGMKELKQSIAKKLNESTSLEYDPDSEIVITHGAQGGLYASLLALGATCSSIFVPDVVWPSILTMIGLAGAKPIAYPMLKGNFAHSDFSSVEKRNAAIVVNSPHNPTGRVLEESELRLLAEIAHSNNFWVVSDAAYEAIIFHRRKYMDIASFPGMRERSILVGSFSKTYCMTGWRIGYVAAPYQMMETIRTISHLSTGGVSLIAQQGALEALNLPDFQAQEMVDEFQTRASMVVEMLQGIPGISVQVPKGTFYLFINITRYTNDSRSFSERLLYDFQTATLPGVLFGKAGEGHIRLSLTVNRDVLRTAIHRLIECLNTYSLS